MNIVQRIKDAFQAVKLHAQNNEHVHNDLSYQAFIVSLLPIPGVQQAARVVERIAKSKALKIKLDDIWDAIKTNNDRINQIEDELEQVHEIGSTVNGIAQLHDQVQAVVEEILHELKGNEEASSWVMETEHWSYQEVLDSIVETDVAKVIAKDHSTNVIEGTEIKAKQTHLHASNNSRNYVDKTTFKGTEGSVGMLGMTTYGNISVEESSISISEGSGLVFGAGNPNIVTGNCPRCGTKVQTDKRKLVGHTHVTCPNPLCLAVMPFTIY